MTFCAETQTITTLLPALRRQARRITNCPHTADDLVQDTALKLLQRMRDGALPDNPRAYAAITLRNLARSRWRRMRETQELTDDMISTPPAAPDRLALAELQEAIRRLPEPQARLMRLVALGETSPKTLSQMTGQPVGTVMSRLARARATLRDRTGEALDEMG